MNFFSSFHRVLGGFFSFILMLASGLFAAAQQPTPGVVAELWPLERPATDSPRRAFEILRSQAPKGKATTLPLNQFEIPARETPSLVRVRGVLTAPEAHGYTFTIDGGDDAELWMEAEAGDWNLVQREGNPIKREGAVPMKPEAPKRFEFWTMGSAKMSVQWESTKWETKDKSRLIVSETIAASRMQAPAHNGGLPGGDGLRAEWKQSQGLDLSSNDGPHGMWGDPDGDGLPNWQEQKAGTHPLKADADGHAGLARWEIWRNIPGQYVFDLTRSANYPDKPDEVRYLHRLQTPVGYGDNYGARVSGWIKAPASGEYTFMLIGDDTAELWLGETESRQSRKLIAKVEQEGVPGKWTRRSEQVEKPLFPEQVSAPISLEQGKSYYVEILHKQLNRRDHCAAAWVVPGATSPQIIGADALVSPRNVKEELPDEKLPEDWLKAVGLLAPEIDPAMRAASADPDHDGLTNWEEWKAGTDPLKPDAREAKNVQHRLTCELWDALPGSRLKDLTLHSQYPSKPTHPTLVDNLDFSDEGDDYGVRLRGYLTASEDGLYVFSISGNDACTLWLAESEDKFTKHPIAETTRGTGWRAYGRSASQQSESIVLKKGRRYYIEVLFKRGARPKTADAPRDHASVAWNRPGRPRTVIGADYFSPYQPDKRDADDDDLPDEWEKAHGLDPNDPTGANGAWGDPDGDLLENFREFQAGLDPKVADVHGAPGFAMWECWENIQGDLSALRNHPSFPLHPTQRIWLNKLEGPQGLGNFYGSRLRAYLVPPATGDYQLAIAGDNQCELWVSATELKYAKEKVAFVKRWTGYREWDQEPGQVSRPIHLEAGKRYFIEALHKQDTKQDHVSVAWKVPGAAKFEVIEGAALAGFAGDPNDLNDDDLPDDWEKKSGISTTLAKQGDQDLDGDGLTNREEFLLGTRPDMASTAGDGVSDLDKVRNLGENPLLADPLGDPVSNVALGTYLSSSANWTMTSSGLLSDNFRGEIVWNFSVPTDGYWLLRLKTELMGTLFGDERVPMLLRVDGKVIARRNVDFGMGKFGTLQALTQYLSEGEHQVSLLVDNTLARRTVRLVSLNVYTPSDAQALLAQSNRLVTFAASTRTSPFCVEGYARDVTMATVNSQPVLNGMGNGHWYADVALADQEGSQTYSVQYEEGYGTKGNIAWEATNALAGETLTIRRGDSLRVGAWGADAAAPSTLTASTGDSWTLIGNQTAAVAFPNAGTVTLQGTLKNGAVGKLTVLVCPAPSFASGQIDTLDGTLRTVTYNAAPELAFEAGEKLATLTMARPDAATASLSLLPLAAQEFGVAARLGIGGPILAIQRVNVIGFADAIQNSLTSQSSSNITGYKLYSTPLTVTNLPAGARVDVSILRAGVMFPNGSTLRSIYPKDLTNGSVVLQFLYPLGMPGAFCHHLLIYDRHGEYLGTR